MPQTTSRIAVWCRPWVAGLMACLLLGLGLVASNERIHAQLHSDSPATHGACSVCALAKGQLDAPILSPTFIFVELRHSWTVSLFESVTPPTPEFSVASSRGPPALSSSL